jgi:hypothetical protein
MIHKRLALLGLILLYWFTRLHELEALAFFLDEAAHADWARLIWRGSPFDAASDGKLLNVFSIAILWPFNAVVWVSRASGVMAGILGLVCLLAFCTRRFSIRAAILSGLLYIFLPLSFFYDRMALADLFSAAGVAVALWATAGAFTTRQPFRQFIWLALSGLALALTLFSKISNLVFLCIPATAVLLLPMGNWRRSATLAGSVYLALGIFFLPPVLIVKYVGQSDLGLDLLTRKTTGTMADPVIITIAAQKLMAFAPFPLWPIIVVGAVGGLWLGGRAGRWLACVLGLTLGAFILRSTAATTESRYFVAYSPLMVSLAGIGLAALTQRWKFVWLAPGMAVMVSSGILFMWQGWTRPEALPLPEADHWQYISGWPSGYGFREIAEDWIASSEPTRLATLDVGGRQRFEGYLLGRTKQVAAERYKPEAKLEGVLLVIDTPKDDQELAGLGLSLKEVARYPRPDNESALVVYRLGP